MQLFQIPPPPQALEATPTEQAVAERDALLTHSATIQAISTREDNEQVSSIGSNIQRMIKDVEDARVSLTAPYLAAQRAIKSTADGFCSPLVAEKSRLGRLAAAYRADQERQAEVLRQQRAAEIARLQEQERLAAENLRLAEKAGDLAGSLMGDLIAEAARVATNSAVAAPVPEATKTAGQSFQARTLGWECTDINALYAARPDLCEPPKPKASAIKSTCAPERPVPGLRLWWESKISFKATR